jgi:predicted AAA+ superfamily ATPase
MVKKQGPAWQPERADYRRVFEDQNPWHTSGKVPEAWARETERPLARHLAARLRVNEPRRFQLIIGPRRVGKTTSMYQTVKRLLADGINPKALWWLRLDHPLLMEISLGDLCRSVLAEWPGATPEQPAYLFLDELAYAEKWDLWLKTFYDETWPVRILGTSSSTAILRNLRQESGVGRWEEQYVAPYLFSEYLSLIDGPVELPVQTALAETLDACVQAKVDFKALAGDRRRFVLTGGFPELLIADKAKPDLDEASRLLQSQRILRDDAVERAIYKDIPQAFSVNNPMMLERLLYTLAGQVTGILSPDKICQSLRGLSLPTFDRYLSYLERAFLVFTLPNYSGSESSVQKRGRKLYFVDSAVRNAALQRGLGPLSDHAEMGLLLENMVAGHLHALVQESQIRLYHWREKNAEIDLVFDHPEQPLAFEIGMSGAHHRKGIAEFVARFPRFQKRCYLVAPDLEARRPQDSWDDIGSLPLDLLLLAAGAQMEQALAKRFTNF